jgi:hypothetical protein
MPPQPLQNNPGVVSIENNFTKGLLTEFTGLNFPENAATDTQNCIYTLIGDVTRREGFDYEANAVLNPVSRSNSAINSYRWSNVGGDGNTVVYVIQMGATIYFYDSTTSTVSSPLSSQRLASTVSMNGFAVSTFDSTQECQFSDGNGYLFIFHPSCDPVYCTYNAGVITANGINIQIRDFSGIVDNLPVSTRPSTLSAEHQYNLQNQGWVSGVPWGGISFNSQTFIPGVNNFWNIQTGLTISPGTVVIISAHVNNTSSYLYAQATGTVVSYSSVSGVIGVAVSPFIAGNDPSGFFNRWDFAPQSIGYINTWFSAESTYPSNADVWWYFKNSSGVFDPLNTANNVTLASGNAPQGKYILSAFNQNRSAISGISGLTTVATNARPATGAWFQGRVWYTGVNASQPASGDVNFYSWSENIYFSQIVQTISDFGLCYQTNDPTSENLFGELPSDGGVISIQGSGNIYKLFPLFNALLVFAANGVWYISGSTGVGFAANDFTIVKLSAVKSISSTSFVDINGLPMFWNEEGIYQVEPAKQGTQLLNSPLHVQPLEVNPLTVGTILSYYSSIPLQSKRYARGSYNPIDYNVQMCFKSTVETSITDRYNYDTVLNFNTYNKAFYPYTFTLSPSLPTINGVIYISSPGGSAGPNSVFKYLTTYNGNFTLSEERDSTFKDWTTSGHATDFTSYFVTGYKIHGQAQRRFQIPYVYMYFRNDALPFSYELQSIWDYASTSSTGRWSVKQVVSSFKPGYNMMFRRHRLRGRGLALQIKVTSVSGQPFDIMGWSALEIQNQGV